MAKTVLHSLDRDPIHVSLRPHCLQLDVLLCGISQALLTELQSKSKGDRANRLFFESLKQTLLVHVLRSYADLEPPPITLSQSLPTPILCQVVEYVKVYLSRDLTLAELAGLAHLSPYHFARAFKETTGQSVHQFVVERRLVAGRRLLETTSLSVTEIAEQVGFAGHSHFSKTFKRAYGLTPRSIAPRYVSYVLPGDTSWTEGS